MMKKSLLFLLIIVSFLLSAPINTIKISAEDGLSVTADEYLSEDKNAPFVLLFHRARWSRGEYRETAPLLNKLGFNCIAIDQRSGDRVNNVENETTRRAAEKKMDTHYLVAYKDMEAALAYVIEKYNPSKILIVGSSYSAALVFRMAAENQEHIDGVIAFSPGEYFSRLGESDKYISRFAEQVKCPVFVTSAANEKESWEGIYNAVPGLKKTSFLPEKGGYHGSEALWSSHPISGEYWQAVNKFIKEYKLNK